jgi:hypothetical protein
MSFEMDRGTEERKQIQRKIRGYLRYVEGPYQEAFQSESLTIAYVTTAGQRRLTDLVHWTEGVLRDVSAESQADLFRFAAFDPGEIEPAAVFDAPLWLRPFNEQAVPLLGEPN